MSGPSGSVMKTSWTGTESESISVWLTPRLGSGLAGCPAAGGPEHSGSPDQCPIFPHTWHLLLAFLARMAACGSIETRGPDLPLDLPLPLLLPLPRPLRPARTSRIVCRASEASETWAQARSRSAATVGSRYSSTPSPLASRSPARPLSSSCRMF